MRATVAITKPHIAQFRFDFDTQYLSIALT